MNLHNLFESANSRPDFAIGDPVIITGDVEFRGKTGDVREFDRDGAFVVVNLYNYGPYSFHTSDVEYNDYADAEDEEDVAEGYDTEELANEVYAEFERMYPNLARRADERTVHAAIMDVLNYGGDNDPAALAQDVARAVKRNMQGVAEGSLEEINFQNRSTSNSGTGELRGVNIPSTMRHPGWKEPTWSFQEIAQKLGISTSALNLLAFKSIGGFPEAVPGLAARHGSKKYYKQSEVKRWVNANNVREKLKPGVAEATGDEKFDKMLKGVTSKKAVAKQQKTDTQQQARDAFGGMFGGGNPADKLGIRPKGVAEQEKAERAEKNDQPWVDPKLKRRMDYAFGHYAGYKDKPEAFFKWVMNSIDHSEQTDQQHDERFDRIEREIEQLSQRLNQVNEQHGAAVANRFSQRLVEHFELDRAAADPTRSVFVESRAAKRAVIREIFARQG